MGDKVKLIFVFQFPIFNYFLSLSHFKLTVESNA